MKKRTTPTLLCKATPPQEGNCGQSSPPVEGWLPKAVGVVFKKTVGVVKKSKHITIK